MANGQCSANFTKTVTVIEGFTNTFSISNNVCLIDGAAQTTNAQIFYTGNAPTAGTTFEWSLDGAVVINGNPQNPAAGFTIAWGTRTLTLLPSLSGSRSRFERRHPVRFRLERIPNGERYAFAC